MRTMAEEDEQRSQLRRIEYQESCRQERERKATKIELAKAAAKLKAFRKANREAEETAAVVTAVKSYSLAMLGQGKKNGGGVQYQKARREIMNRMRVIATLSADQKNDWQNFCVSWDQKMAEAHGEDWAELFAQIVQNVLNLLEGGNANALSDFMHRETVRVLGDIPVLRLPGMRR